MDGVTKLGGYMVRALAVMYTAASWALIVLGILLVLLCVACIASNLLAHEAVQSIFVVFLIIFSFLTYVRVWGQIQKSKANKSANVKQVRLITWHGRSLRHDGAKETPCVSKRQVPSRKR